MKEFLKLKTSTSIFFDGPEITPKQWAKVKKAVENIGGEWDTPTQSWIFPFDVTRLYEIIQDKKFKLSSHYQFFETPSWLIGGYMSMRYQMMTADAFCSHYKVLEPSAGRGNILSFLKQWGLDADYCELMPENREILEKKGFKPAIGENFLDLDKPNYYDLVFANPPFNKDTQHIKKMFEVSKSGGYIVTLASENILDDKKFSLWLEENSKQIDAVVISPFKDDADIIIGEQIFKGTKVGCTLLVCQKR